jgi:hypothetical protein
MTCDTLPTRSGDLRGRDTNTLLRFYDAAGRQAREMPYQYERDRAARARDCIARELRRRGVEV